MLTRLIFDSARSGAANMALDEAHLRLSAEQSQATLRFYEWLEPTLSLGYFQRYADRQQAIGCSDCPLIRRSSGGGAILHDQELTYCLTMPLVRSRTADAEQLYFSVHSSLQKALADWNIGTKLYDGPVRTSDQQMFFCFERRSLGDLIVQQSKVAGSAQRRWHGCLLQHGSVLLRTSPHAAQLPGLEALTECEVSAQDLRAAWYPHLAAEAGLTLQPDEIGPKEWAVAQDLAVAKYTNIAWLRKR